MGKCFVDKAALLAVAGMLAAIANDEIGEPKRKPLFGKQPRDSRGRFATRTTTQDCRCEREPFDFDCFDDDEFSPFERPMCPPPAPRWGVCECEPREDKNKVFGVNIRVDEPRRHDYCSRAEFERDHAKFDRLVDAAEACTWENKSNTAPLHKVNAIRRSVFEDPVFATGGRNLVGETDWF